jgi:predicted MFS family arabinose efflux permease
MGAVPRTQQGVAGSVANMMRTLGIVLGATGASMLSDERRQVYFKEFVPAFQDVFIAAAALCAAACILSLLRQREAGVSPGKN